MIYLNHRLHYKFTQYSLKFLQLFDHFNFKKNEVI